MRTAFLTAFILNIGMNLLSLWILPETAAIHFGSGGRPDDWASREFHALMMMLVDVLVFFPLYFASSLIDRVPPRLLSLPYKQYWLREENRTRAKQLLARFMDEFGLVLFGFLFGVTLLAVAANRSDPVQLNERLFLVLFAGFMVYTFGWTIRLVVRLRPPR